MAKRLAKRRQFDRSAHQKAARVKKVGRRRQTMEAGGLSKTAVDAAVRRGRRQDAAEAVAAAPEKAAVVKKSALTPRQRKANVGGKGRRTLAGPEQLAADVVDVGDGASADGRHLWDINGDWIGGDYLPGGVDYHNLPSSPPPTP